jgi:hypothetical protein
MPAGELLERDASLRTRVPGSLVGKAPQDGGVQKPMQAKRGAPLFPRQVGFQLPEKVSGLQSRGVIGVPW